MSHIPADIKPSREKYGTAHRAQYRATDVTPSGFTIARQGAQTKVLLDGNMMRWATSEWVSSEFLDRLKGLRNTERRAPLGDSHGAWQRVAEIPFSLLMDRIPPDAWEDDKAIGKVLNDPDLRAFRTDGAHRRY